jgi:hypothetical protein
METARLGHIESRLDSLAIENLGRGVNGVWEQTVCRFAGRAVTLERGIRACADIPAAAAVHILVRSLVDLVILADWIAQDPLRRIDLWKAEGELENARYIRRALDSGLVDDLAQDPVEAERIYLERMAAVNKARTAAKLAANADPLPSIESMAKAVGPDHVKQLYTGAFRPTSGYTHTSFMSFAEMAMQGAVEGPVLNSEGTRRTGAALLAHVMALASRVADLKIETECDQLHDELVGSH